MPAEALFLSFSFHSSLQIKTTSARGNPGPSPSATRRTAEPLAKAAHTEIRPQSSPSLLRVRLTLVCSAHPAKGLFCRQLRHRKTILSRPPSFAYFDHTSSSSFSLRDALKRLLWSTTNLPVGLPLLPQFSLSSARSGHNHAVGGEAPVCRHAACIFLAPLMGQDGVWRKGQWPLWLVQ
jgi:hypothetical protein